MSELHHSSHPQHQPKFEHTKFEILSEKLTLLG
jgi:hypothetical protein